MGKAIEKIALTKKYKIHSIVNCQSDLKKIDLSTADIGIEFTNPKSAFENISFCLKSNLPVVSGSTGWLAELKTIEKIPGTWGILLDDIFAGLYSCIIQIILWMKLTLIYLNTKIVKILRLK